MNRHALQQEEISPLGTLMLLQTAIALSITLHTECVLRLNDITPLQEFLMTLAVFVGLGLEVMLYLLLFAMCHEKHSSGN